MTKPKTTANRSKKGIKNRIIWMFAILLLFGGIFVFSNNKAASNTVSQVEIPTQTAITDEPTSKEAAYRKMLVDDDPYLGPDDAPVVIIEFSDYMCPYCGKFFSDTLPQILETYPEEVKFVHRDYLLMGDASLPALIAAGCALEQDKYWEMNTLLFSVYQDMDLSDMDHSYPPVEKGNNPFQNKFSDDKLTEYAQAIGLDMEAYNNCVSEMRPAQEILNDFETAQGLGIWSIPVYIINQQVIVGYRSFEDFQPYIERALADITQ